MDCCIHSRCRLSGSFYLGMPVFLWVIWKYWLDRNDALAVVAVMLLAPLGLSVRLTVIKSDATFFLLPTRALGMLAGRLVELWVGGLESKV